MNVRLFLLLALVVGLVYGRLEKIQPLQPITASLIVGIPEPSGLCFCDNRLFGICDKGKCHYVYEIDTNATLVEQWKFSKDFKDIESVTCDPIHNVLYIAEESRHAIHSFRLPVSPGDWIEGEKHNELILLPGTILITPASDDAKSGIEGMTYDTKRELLYVANEKHPKVLYAMYTNGTLISETLPDFSGDLSGLAYDDNLHLNWYLSDQSERLFVGDLQGENIYDYWDLPMENCEGIAIDNSHKPPLLYIATDPSSPSGPQYVPALFTFVKPSIGEGLVYYDPANPPPYEVIACDGCDEVYAAADALIQAYEDEKFHNNMVIVVSVLVPVLCTGCIALVFCGFFISIATYNHRLETDHRAYDASPTFPVYAVRKLGRKVKAFFSPSDEAELAFFEELE